MTTGQDTILGTDTVQDALKVKVNDDMTELFAISAEVIAARSGSASLLAQIASIQALIAALTPTAGFYSACTSGTRPAFAAIVHGQLIGETDTGNFYLVDKDGDLGVAERWIPLSTNRYAHAGLPATGATYTVLEGTRAYDTTNKGFVYYNGTAWDVYDELPDILLFGGL
jgi:hypothetical protein